MTKGIYIIGKQNTCTVLHSKRVDFFLNLHADLSSTAGN